MLKGGRRSPLEKRRKEWGGRSPRRLAAGAGLSAALYVALDLASGALVGAYDSKLMLVVKCGALGAAGLLLYLLLMGRACLSSFSKS